MTSTPADRSDGSWTEAFANWIVGHPVVTVAILVAGLVFGLHLICRRLIPSIYLPVVAGVWSTVYKLWCWLWVLWWGLNHAVRRALLSTALGVALVASVPALLDSILVVFHAPVIEALHHVPTSVRVSAAAIFFLLAYMRLMEWRDHRRRRIFMGIVRRMSLEMSAFDLSDQEEKAREQLWAFFTKVLVGFRPLFSTNVEQPNAISLNIMLPDATTQRLVIAVQYPDGTLGESPRDYDGAAKFERNDGVAGTAWQQCRMLYVPRISMQHAIAIELLDGEHPRGVELRPDLYRPLPQQPFRSIMAVPVRLPENDEQGGVVAGSADAVLNVDSTKGNAFGESGWEFASIAAAFIAQGLSRYKLKFSNRLPIPRA